MSALLAALFGVALFGWPAFPPENVVAYARGLPAVSGGTLDVGGTVTLADPGWKCISINIIVMNLADPKLTRFATLHQPVNPWAHGFRNLPPGPSQMVVVTNAIFMKGMQVEVKTASETVQLP